MLTSRIAIIGGGLSGLYAAHLLEQQGIKDYVLLEARGTFGGRVESAPFGGTQLADTVSVPNGVSRKADRFDLGPTWFWPAFQPELDRVIRDLGLTRFQQHEAGDMVIERSSMASPERMRGHLTSPPSMRLAGGMGALVDALRSALPPDRLHSGQRVRHLHVDGQHIGLETEDIDGRRTSYRVDHVLLAVPPRLAMAAIVFSPALPDALAQAWSATATWMAPHAKYVAVYDTPFWREQGLSGQGRSARGPLAEIHDASSPGGRAALFGFLGVPAHARTTIPDDQLLAHCRAQLTRMFGVNAGSPRAEFIKDWANDPYTATAADREGATLHEAAPLSSAGAGAWRGRIVGIASEWSPQFPGYLAGAIEAAGRGVQTLLKATPQERQTP
ncbi:flavin monoamine oxidase family protein [Roseateles chitinivorans]|uniref:flavin monoamine oxidase family protein n=1 Tax=Roseateles chitinivorans TaxID=2917965 RepID=UPI003D67ECAB